MKANEFVKKFGLGSFKAAMLCPQFKRYNYAILYSDEVDFSNEFIEKHTDYMFKTSELKRLVEAHEIIKLFKSLDHAKTEAQACEHSKHSEILVKLDVGVGYIWLSRVNQAIADVESCQ